MENLIKPKREEGANKLYESNVLFDEVAKELNKRINLPFLSEKTEYKLFYKLTEIFFDILDNMVLPRLLDKVK